MVSIYFLAIVLYILNDQKGSKIKKKRTLYVCSETLAQSDYSLILIF